MLAAMHFLTLQVRDWHASHPPQFLSVIILGEKQYSAMVGLKTHACTTRATQELLASSLSATHCCNIPQKLGQVTEYQLEMRVTESYREDLQILQ